MDTRKEKCRKGGIQDFRDTGIQERRDSGLEGFRTGGIQEGWIQD